MAANLTGDATLSLSAQRTGVAGNIISESWSQVDQSYDELLNQFITLANGASDTVVSLGAVDSGQLVLIVSDQPISTKLNTSTEAIAFKTLLLSSTTVTAVKLSNASGSEANVRVIVLGT